MTRDEVLEAIHRELAGLLASVDALGEGATTVAVTGEGWTAKDVLAHCVHWAGQMAWAIGAPLAPPAYIIGLGSKPSEEEWNAMAVAHYGALSLTQVRAELERVVRSLESRVRLTDDAEMLRTDRVAWDPGVPLWKQIGGETFLHWPRHVADLEAARESLSP